AGPGDARPRPDRVRGCLCIRGHQAEAAAHRRAGIRVWVGAGGPAIPRVPQAADGRILSAGSRDPPDAAGFCRKRPALSGPRGAVGDDEPGRPGRDCGRLAVVRGRNGRESRVCPGTIRAYLPYKAVGQLAMTTKTRYFVIASLLVIGVGLGTG